MKLETGTFVTEGERRCTSSKFGAHRLSERIYGYWRKAGKEGLGVWV